MPPKAKRGSSPARAPVAKAKAGPKAKAKSEPHAAGPAVEIKPEPESHVQIEAQIVSCFRSFDANGDGKISRSELVEVVSLLDTEGDFRHRSIDTLLDEVDKNSDGQIDYAEFAAWVMDGSDEAMRMVTKGSDVKFLKRRLDWCLEEVKLGEEATTLKLVEKWFERDDNIGMSYGKVDEGRSNVVTRISKDGVAYNRGVCLGWLVHGVGDVSVTGRTYLPDVIMEARKHSGCKIKFVTPDALEQQKAAEDRLPGLWAAVDLAKDALDAANKQAVLANSTTEVPKKEPEVKKPEPEPEVKGEEPEALPDPSKALAIWKDKTGDGYVPTYGELMVAMGCAEDKKEGLKENPYQILHVAYTATQEEIKKAFMFLARMYHPDKYPEDPKAAKYRFDRIKKAYDSLRTEEARAEVDRELIEGGMDLLSLYMADPKKAAEKMIKVPAHLDVDPDAHPGVNSSLKEKGAAIILYYDYKMPFPVPDGTLAASEIDNIYGLSDAMPGCELYLADWRKGRTHICHHGETDSGASGFLKKEKGVFHGIQAGQSYFLLVQEAEEESKKNAAVREWRRREKEAAAKAATIVHKCEDEQIYVFGLGNVCRICSDKDTDFS